MEWFKKSKSGIVSTKKKEIQDNLWVKCDGCAEIIYKKELEKQLYICGSCGAHFRITSKVYRQILLDPETTFTELDINMSSVDVLNFTDKKSYASRIIENQKKSGLKDAVTTGIGFMAGKKVAFGLMDFDYMGGSMGSVVGEKLTRLISHATAENLPLIIISASGGARMQEGAFSLMQMAKTSAALALHAAKNLPFFSILTHPTYGGTTASFAMLGDVNIAEPGALVGFAGPRVIRETIRQELPAGFQRSEFLLNHGFVDLIADRRELRKVLINLISHFTLVKHEQVEKSDLFVDAGGNLRQKVETL